MASPTSAGEPRAHGSEIPQDEVLIYEQEDIAAAAAKHERNATLPHNAPSFKKSKPKLDTRAHVDDQMSDLSHHADKIRLDDVKQHESRDKDKADRATHDQVLDPHTRMLLLHMINTGTVSEIHGAISTGKEANVYGAVLLDEQGEETQRAIKVYKTAILGFKDRDRYIVGEQRFKQGPDKGNVRKMIKLWAEKEFRNLKRLHAAGIPCPEPLSLNHHVLAMGFLGNKKGLAYPRLRDANIDNDEQWRSLYIQLLGWMRKMYQKCRLVHADLSEYNILYHDSTLYIIDVSQSVEPDHPMALQFLRMDIKNVGDFFRRKRIGTIPDRVLFEYITDPEPSTDTDAMQEHIEKLLEETVDAVDEEQATKFEVDTEVFRKQWIPQSLDEVYDIERGGSGLDQSGGDIPLYVNMIADKCAGKPGSAVTSGASSVADDSDSDSDDEGAALDDDDDDDSKKSFEKGTPRGRKFEDKDEKKARKQAVKEAKREKRKDKIPKYKKKKMIDSTSRRKK